VSATRILVWHGLERSKLLISIRQGFSTFFRRGVRFTLPYRFLGRRVIGNLMRRCGSRLEPFEAEEREREETVGGVAKGTTFNGRGEHKFI
jgi:hypothetical protein